MVPPDLPHFLLQASLLGAEFSPHGSDAKWYIHLACVLGVGSMPSSFL